MNLYKKYKAKNLDEIFGHETVVKSLTKRIAQNTIPNVIIFTGESGKGKTVLAEIMAKTIVCLNPLPTGHACNDCANCKAMDAGNYTRAVKLMNSSDLNKSGAQDLADNCLYTNMYAPKSGPRPGAIVYILNEFQGATSAAMENMLMLLEKETLTNVYFILATMDENSIPDKVRKALIDRNAYFHLKDIKPEPLLKLMLAVYHAETNNQITPEIQKLLMAIVYNANGSVRTAYRLLERLIDSEIMNEDELLSELNIISETKVTNALKALIVGDSRLFFSVVSEFNAEVFFKIRANLILLFQSKLGADLGYKENYIRDYKNAITLENVAKILETLNSVRPFATSTDYIYIFSQSLMFMKSVRPQNNVEQRVRKPV